jgi:hypothetical protein
MVYLCVSSIKSRRMYLPCALTFPHTTVPGSLLSGPFSKAPGFKEKEWQAAN